MTREADDGQLLRYGSRLTDETRECQANGWKKRRSLVLELKPKV